MDIIRDFFEYAQVDWPRLAKAIGIVAAACAFVGVLMYGFVSYPRVCVLVVLAAVLGWIIYVIYDDIL